MEGVLAELLRNRAGAREALDKASSESSDALAEEFERKERKEAKAATPPPPPAGSGAQRVQSSIGALFGNDDMSDCVFIVGTPPPTATPAAAPGGAPGGPASDAKSDAKEVKAAPAPVDEKELKEHTFPAHKVILGAGSAVFRRLLYGAEGKGLEREEKDKSGRTVINISDTPAPIFRLLLQGLYTGTVDVTLDNMTPVLKAATTYAVPAAAAACEAFLDDALTPETAWDMFGRAATMGLAPTFGLEFCANNFQRIKGQPGFLRLPVDRLALLLADDTLVEAKEVEIFNLVVQWGEAEVKRRAEAKEEVELKTVLADVLKHVRFPLMPIDQLSSVVSTRGLLPMDDLLACFSYVSVTDPVARKSIPMAAFSTKPRPTRARYIPKPVKVTAVVAAKVAAKPTTGPWACPACTYENPSGPRCQICDSPRPK